MADPRSRRYTISLVLSAAVFAALAAAVILSERADRLDVRFVRWVHEHAPTWLVDAMRVLTYLGSAWVLVPLAVVAVALLVRQGYPRAALFVALALAVSQLLVQLLKLGFRRDRPELQDPILELATYSFPSGHAFGATAFYGALALVLASSARSSAQRVPVFLTAAMLIVVVAASRVILGVHYLLDVVAGIAGGIALLSALLLLLRPSASGRRSARRA